MQSIKSRLLNVFGSFLFAIALLFASVILPVKSNDISKDLMINVAASEQSHADTQEKEEKSAKEEIEASK